MRRFNLLVDGKGGFSVDYCLRSVFQLVNRESHIPERFSFAPVVAGLACNHKALLIELDGAAGLSQSGVCHAQVAERLTFAPAVAGLECDLEVLLMELDGAAGLSQDGVGHAQVAERPTFRITLFQSLGCGEHRFEPSNAFVRMLPQVEHVDT